MCKYADESNMQKKTAALGPQFYYIWDIQNTVFLYIC